MASARRRWGAGGGERRDHRRQRHRAHSRGSFRVDDEGTPAQRTVLVQDGMLTGYMKIDGTTGSCGKNGQWKPVGVGQPTVRFTEITVGGTIV